MSDAHDPWKLVVNDRIHLTAIRPTDRTAFVEHLDDKEMYERMFRVPHPYTEADADKFIDIVAGSTKKHGHPVHFAIRDETEKLIGGCGFEGLSYGHRAEIGYWLAKPLWGQGIMTDVVAALCKFAQREWRLVRIIAHVFVFNEASARVLEKAGFAFEGLLRKYHRKDGNFIDSKLYALVQ